MASIAQATLFGRIGKVDIKQNANGESYAKLTLATTESYKKNGEWVNITNWHNLTTFNKNTVEYIERNVPVGREALVTGNIRTRPYDDSEGKKHTSHEIFIDNIQVHGPRPE